MHLSLLLGAPEKFLNDIQMNAFVFDLMPT